MQDNFSFISTQLDNIHISTSSISNITSLSPTITQEVAVEDAIDSATTRVREEIASALVDGESSRANNSEAMQTRCLMKVLTRLKDSVHEFDMAFDLVKDNSMGLQMPLQVTEVISTPTWGVEIDYRGDMHSRKSNVAADECLETSMDIVFGGSLQQNEFDLQCQFINLKLVVTENFVFHEILSSDFDGPIRVDGEISLIPRDDDAEIAESYPCLFNQSFFADFGALAMCESMTDGLPTCYRFDTGKYVSQSITFVFRRRKCSDHLSATDFDKNGYLPIIGAQGGGAQFFAIMCSSCYSSGDDSKTACEGAADNWLLDMLASYLAMGSGNSKVHQVFDTISNEACKASNVMFTLLLVGVLVETHKET
ncbi:hypothetical protein H5410_053874 [Solanum commersonii]|uniref:Uncharacterized protein n=1 Tax=Solanum commersonii TaxID=4109 RepID=A0A9J5X663_SOLCO|nr:hypothetical protein H5410_053874 [Solanum commersonii]